MSRSATMPARLKSLDALRGFDMLFIMGGGTLIRSLCDLFGWGIDCAFSQQFEHVIWHGLHFEDMIFPVFLFIAGVSFPYSMAKQLDRGCGRSEIFWRNARRAAALFALGLVYGGQIFGPDWSKVIWGSVLGRIGIAWFLASVLFLFVGLRGRIAVSAALLLGYWALMLFVTAPDASSVVLPENLLPYEGAPFAPSTNVAGYIDRMLLPGRITIPGVISNQGILSTVPAVVTAMFGMFTGEFMRGVGARMSAGRRLLCLFAAGALLLAGGCLVAFGFGRWSMPFNKILWSTSFTLTVGGVAVLAFAVFHWVVDVRGWERAVFPFTVIGMNSITIYLLQKLVAVDLTVRYFVGGFEQALGQSGFRVALYAGHVILCWLFLYFLYRRKVFLKV